MKAGNRKTRNPAIVVEAGSKQVKIVQIVRSGKKAKIAKISACRLEGVATIKTLGAAVKKLKLAKIPVIGCLPRQDVTVRLLEVPSTDSNEIADMVELQIGKQTPYSRDEILADYRIIGAGRQGYTRVMLIIVQRSLMSQRFRLLEEAGLEVESMSVSSEGVLAWYCAGPGAKEKRGVSVLLDIDEEYTDFAVISSGQLVFTKSIRIGAEQLLEESEACKNRFAEEVENAIEIYRGESGTGASPGRIFITGAGANVPGLNTLLEKSVKSKIQVVESLSIASPGKGMPNMSSPEYQATSMTAIMGMALVPESLQFNLVPEPVSMRRNLEVKAKSLTTLGIMLTAVLSIAAALAMTAMLQRMYFLSALQADRDKKAPQVADVGKKAKTTRDLAARLDSSRSPVNLLKELHKITPPDVISYDSVSIDTEAARMVIKGKAKDFSYINELEANLRNSTNMYDEVVRGRQDAVGDYVQFDIAISTPKTGDE